MTAEARGRRTVKAYEQWLRRFLRFHRLRHPREMGSAEVNVFLSHLAVHEQVSASTQNQALSALLFLYRDLLERELEIEGVVRARTRQRLPVVLSEAEVRAVRERLEGEPALVVGLLRVKDLDVQRREHTLLPQSVVPAPGRSGRRLGECADALRPGPEIPKRQPGVVLAMGVPPAEALA